MTVLILVLIAAMLIILQGLSGLFGKVSSIEKIVMDLNAIALLLMALVVLLEGRLKK